MLQLVDLNTHLLCVLSLLHGNIVPHGSPPFSAPLLRKLLVTSLLAPEKSTYDKIFPNVCVSPSAMRHSQDTSADPLSRIT